MLRRLSKLPVNGISLPTRIRSRLLASTAHRGLATVAAAPSNAGLTSPGDSLHGFRLSKIDRFPIFDLTAYQLIHEKTGAQYLHLARAGDTNKVFSISFRTNPPDDTGVPHILEHTTLCGSEKYPVRDPFFKMLPRSLSHFMNAFTSPDHTSYPFATTNRQDFSNLLSVYMDATLHPLLSEKDFNQEGWRLGPDHQAEEHADNAGDSSDKIVFKGVVYNEMKGYMSDPSSYFYMRFHQAIVPALNNSAGDPSHITELTHQQLKDFHASHYHPSNSRIFTYSDIPLEEHLEEIGTRLDKFEKRQDDDVIVNPISLSSSRSVMVDGPVPDSTSPASEQWRTSTTWIVDDKGDPVTRFSLGLMTNLLIDGYSSPMYRAIIEGGLGKSFSPNTGHLRVGSKLIFSVGAIGVEEGKIASVNEAVAKALISSHIQGLDKKKVDGILQQLDLGVKHKSSSFGFAMMQRIVPEWFRGVEPFEVLSWQDIIEGFKERYTQPRYLESLLEEALLNAPTFTFTMKPLEKYTEKMDANEQQRLSEKLEVLYTKFPSEKDAQKHLQEQEAALHDATAASQQLSCLPTLHVSDISRLKAWKTLEQHDIDGVKCLWRKAPTNGITYFRAVNLLENLPHELRELVPLFSDCLFRLGTQNMTMEQIEEEIKLKTGGISVSHHTSTSPFDRTKFEEGLGISGYAFDGNVPALLDLVKTIIMKTDFDSPESEAKIKELIQDSAATTMDVIAESGHRMAAKYALSSISPESQATEQTNGVSQLFLMKELARNSERGALQSIIDKLKQIQQVALSKSSNLRIAITCGTESTSANESALSNFLASLPTAIPPYQSSLLVGLPFSHKQKAFLDLPFQVSYLGLALPGTSYADASGAPLAVLSQLLTHKYLHHEIREKGGAYGAGANSNGLLGTLSFYSYRDPTPTRSLAVIRGAGRWAQEQAFSEQDIEEAKISVFKGMDAPEDIAEEGMLQFLSGIDKDMAQKRREELLDVTKDQLREAADRLIAKGFDEDKAAAMIIGPLAGGKMGLEKGWTSMKTTRTKD